MPDMSENLRTEIIAASTTLGNRVHQDVVPQSQMNTFPRCWFSRRSVDRPLTLDSEGGWNDARYDVEVISDDIDEALTAADALSSTSGIHGKLGTFGSGTAKCVSVEDQDENYVPKGVGEDDGLFVSALSVRIVY